MPTAGLKLLCSFYNDELLWITTKFTNSEKIIVGTILQIIGHRKRSRETTNVGRGLHAAKHRKLINKAAKNEPDSGRLRRIWPGSNGKNVMNYRFMQHNVMRSLQFFKLYHAG